MYFSVSVGGQTSVVFGPVATASYTVPAVSSVTVPVGGLLATTGSENVVLARRSSAEHLITSKALRCTATAWMLIVAQCSAIPRQDGTNFGPAGTVVTATYASTAGGYPESGVPYSTKCTMITDHEKVSCPTVPGTGTGFAWTVHVGEQASDPSATTTDFMAPVVDTISGANIGNAKTEGNQVVFISGHSFGPAGGDDLTATYGAGNRFDAVNCEVKSDTLAQCFTAPGTGKDHAVRVTISGQTSNDSDAANLLPVAVPRNT